MGHYRGELIDDGVLPDDKRKPRVLTPAEELRRMAAAIRRKRVSAYTTYQDAENDGLNHAAAMCERRASKLEKGR